LIRVPEYLNQWSNDITNQRDQMVNKIDSIKYHTDLINKKIEIAKTVKDQVQLSYIDQYDQIIMTPLLNELKELEEEAKHNQNKLVSIEMFDKLIKKIEEHTYLTEDIEE